MSDVLQFPARPAPACTDAAPVAIAAHDGRHKVAPTALAWAWTHAKRAWRARLDALGLPYGLTARLEREWREEIRKHGIAGKARRRAELAKQAERAAEMVEMLETWA